MPTRRRFEGKGEKNKVRREPGWQLIGQGGPHALANQISAIDIP
jgi:hypothetical protein